MDDALSILRQTFGHAAFRGPQAEVVAHLAGGGDALLVMPAGGGKALCSQVAALLRPGTALVVSARIAAMRDRVAALREDGVRAACLHAGQAAAEADAAVRDFAAGRLDLLYVSPERLLSPHFAWQLARAEGHGFALFVIEEAHRVVRGSPDFEPEYLRLGFLHERWPAVPRLALTASADAAGLERIVAGLRLEGARPFVSSLARPNVRYRIVETDDAWGSLLAFLRTRHAADSGIVHCRSRRRAEQTAARLAAAGLRALPHHAGMDSRLRAAHREVFRHEDGVVLVTTLAWDAELDRAELRFVAHLDPPAGIEEYWRDTGRAGRDGLPADAWLAYDPAAAAHQRRLLEAAAAGPRAARLAAARFDALLGLCRSDGCRQRELLAHFGQQGGPCGQCDRCLEPTAQDVTEAARKALSCVYRCGQRHGPAHLIDVLLGRETGAVRRRGHHRLSTFGIGTELTAGQWQRLFRRLLDLGLLAEEPAGGALVLTPSSRPVLQGEQTVLLRAAAAAVGPPPACCDAGLEAAARDLYGRLRAWRAATAGARGVPPHALLHGATLLALARRRPRSLAALAGIDGLGERKLQEHGAALLALLTQTQT